MPQANVADGRAVASHHQSGCSSVEPNPTIAVAPPAVQSAAAAAAAVSRRCRLHRLLKSATGESAPLPRSIRLRFERLLGVDLSNVRIHCGDCSDRLCAILNARAFAVQQNIYFAAGQFRPDTFDGLELLAHEIAHTLQQQPLQPGWNFDELPISDPASRAEMEAKNFALLVAGLLTGARPEQAPGYGRVPRFQLSSCRPGIFCQRQVSEASQQQFLREANSPVLIAMFEDSFRSDAQPRMTPGRVAHVGNWHRMLTRDWLRSNRRQILDRIQTRLTALTRANQLDQIRSIQDRINNVHPSTARQQLQRAFDRATRVYLGNHDAALRRAILNLKAALRRFCGRPLRSIIFNQPRLGNIYSDQAVQYENFAGAINVFRDVVHTGSTRHQSSSSQAAAEAAQRAVAALSQDERAAIRRDWAAVERVLNIEGRDQLRRVARERDYRLSEGFPERAIR